MLNKIKSTSNLKQKRKFVISRLQDLSHLPHNLDHMTEGEKIIYDRIFNYDFDFWEIVKQENGWTHTKKLMPEEQTLVRKRSRVREYFREHDILPEYGSELTEEQQKILNDVENNNFEFFEEVKQQRQKLTHPNITSGNRLTPEEIFLSGKRKRVREYFRLINVLPEYGSELTEEQQKILNDIENNNFEFFEEVKQQRQEKRQIAQCSTVPKKVRYEKRNTDGYTANSEPKLVLFRLRMVQILPPIDSILNEEQNNIVKDVYENGFGKSKSYFLTKYLHLSTPEGRILFRTYKKHTDEGFNFNLTIDDIIIPEYCPILNIKLTTDPKDKDSPNYYSIDRIDSSKGYVKGNVQIISMKANKMKSKSTEEELLKFSLSVLKLFNND
jgi:hypothetical protein